MGSEAYVLSFLTSCLPGLMLCTWLVRPQRSFPKLDCSLNLLTWWFDLFTTDTENHRATMCYIHYNPEEDYYDDIPEPGPRPLPRLTWAVPVSIAQLGASLEAYNALVPTMRILRLCHRFDNGPLSTLPQEILDLILTALYQSARKDTRQKWITRFLCFQGRCSRSQHILDDDDLVKDLWRDFSTNTDNRCPTHRREEDLNPDDYQIEQKREMVAEYVEDDHELLFETIWEEHESGRNQWLDMVCLCRDHGHFSGEQTFLHLQAVSCLHFDVPLLAYADRLVQLLQTSFGLEATILHEMYSERMRNFLPSVRSPASTSYYTSCFLTLPLRPVVDLVPRSRTLPHANPGFIHNDNYSAYHHEVDLAGLQISEKQTSAFTRALRILDLQPVYHLTELEPSLAPSTADTTLAKISNLQLSGWPKVSSASIDKKKLRFKRFLKAKNEGMQTMLIVDCYSANGTPETKKQKWPRLMVMAASNVVSPHNY